MRLKSESVGRWAWVLVVCGALDAQAQSTTSRWTNAGGDYQWTNPANWSDNTVPGPASDVVFDDSAAGASVVSNSAAFYPIFRDILLSRTGGFNLDNGGYPCFAIGGNVRVLRANEPSPYVVGNIYGISRVDVAAGSTLHFNRYWPLGNMTVSGGGRAAFQPDINTGFTSLTLADGSTTEMHHRNGWGLTVGQLRGAGTFILCANDQIMGLKIR